MEDRRWRMANPLPSILYPPYSICALRGAVSTFRFPPHRLLLNIFDVPGNEHMKEIIPSPPAVERNDVAAVQALFQTTVMPTYGRFDLALSHGAGSYVYDVAGKRYLDLGAGIAVLALGHAHPAITEALIEQSRKLVHVSNLYYH